jgi:hypothetical protein
MPEPLLNTSSPVSDNEYAPVNRSGWQDVFGNRYSLAIEVHATIVERLGHQVSLRTKPDSQAQHRFLHFLFDQRDFLLFPNKAIDPFSVSTALVFGKKAPLSIRQKVRKPMRNIMAIN